jgi:hypothetical protein
MSKREQHVGKTQQQRQAYGRYIQSLDYEPTVDEQIDFGSTEKGGEELAESTSKRPSRGYTQNKIKEHIKEHWIEWIIAIVVIFALFLINESRVTTTIMSNNLTTTNEKVTDIKTNVEVLNNKVEQLQFQSVINTKDIEFLKDKKK